jgi:hypothetical protein
MTNKLLEVIPAYLFVINRENVRHGKKATDILYTYVANICITVRVDLQLIYLWLI